MGARGPRTWVESMCDCSQTVGQKIIIFGRWTPLGLGMCLLGFLRNSGNVRNFPHPTSKNYFCSTNSGGICGMAPFQNTGDPLPTPVRNTGESPPAPEQNTGAHHPTPVRNIGEPPPTPVRNTGDPPQHRCKTRDPLPRTGAKHG